MKTKLILYLAVVMLTLTSCTEQNSPTLTNYLTYSGTSGNSLNGTYGYTKALSTTKGYFECQYTYHFDGNLNSLFVLKVYNPSGVLLTTYSCYSYDFIYGDKNMTNEAPYLNDNTKFGFNEPKVTCFTFKMDVFNVNTDGHCKGTVKGYEQFIVTNPKYPNGGTFNNQLATITFDFTK